jgi:uncharacterized protein (TIGR02145 family)
MMTTKKLIRALSLCLILIISFSCKKADKPAFLPDVFTSPVTGVLYSTAVSGGNVTYDGGAFVVSRGVCWSVSENPTIDDNKTIDGAGAGEYSSSLYALKPGTLYYVRAYAINSKGTEYGDEISFTTKIADVKFNTNLTYGTVTDIEGKNYKTIPVGIQTWMAENLKTTKYNDGSAIPKVVSDAQWTNITTPAYCWFEDNDSLYADIYGGYYNWFTVNTGKLCPAGWHIPSDAEWQVLVDFLGGNKVAGSKIKETGTNNWVLSNKDATNATGFTALPSGMRGATDGTFSGQGYYGGWWSSTELDPSPLASAWNRWIHGDTTVVARSQIFKKDGFNVRCLKD